MDHWHRNSTVGGALGFLAPANTNNHRANAFQRQRDMSKLQNVTEVDARAIEDRKGQCSKL